MTPSEIMECLYGEQHGKIMAANGGIHVCQLGGGGTKTCLEESLPKCDGSCFGIATKFVVLTSFFALFCCVTEFSIPFTGCRIIPQLLLVLADNSLLPPSLENRSCPNGSLFAREPIYIPRLQPMTVDTGCEGQSPCFNRGPTRWLQLYSTTSGGIKLKLASPCLSLFRML